MPKTTLALSAMVLSASYALSPNPFFLKKINIFIVFIDLYIFLHFPPLLSCPTP